jgi:MFS family permease
VSRLPARSDRATFVALFCASLACFLGLGAVLPALPRYVTGPLDEGDVAVGVVVGAFAFSAVICRPFAGRAADRRGRRLVLRVGATLMAIAGGCYFLANDVLPLVLARLILGVGDAMVFTAGAAWAVDIAPEERRGQAIGLFGLSIWTGLALGPVIGEALRELGGFDAVWAFAAIAPVGGVLLAGRIPDPPQPVAAATSSALVPSAAVRPGVALALANLGYAALSGFVVLHLAKTGVGHGAAVFTAFAFAVVAMRLVGGRLPDLIGPARSAVGAAVAEAAGLVAIAAATSLPVALLGALAMGAGFSLLYPSLALIVVNRTEPAERGAALGTFTAFFDAGVGLGGPLAGAIASFAGYPAAFSVAAGAALLGAVLTVLSARPALRPVPA